MPTTEHYLKLSKEGGKHAALFHDMALWSAEQGNNCPLTAVELTVARKIKEGVSRQTIAFDLDVSQVMISKHVSSIREKLGKPSVNDAAVVYLLAERGWLP